jgi:hypothetical protein
MPLRTPRTIEVPGRIAKPTGRRASSGAAALLAIVALAGAGASLSGCGASATLDPVARAADVSSQQTGVRFTLSVHISSSGLAAGAGISASGYVNQREHSGEMTMNLAGLSALGGSSEAPSGFEHIQMVFKYPVVYVGLPALADKLPEGKTWMKLDLTQLAKEHGVQLPQLSSLDQTNPSEFLRYLRASGGDVTALGSESVNGVPTTHYRATLSLSRILESYPASDRTAMRSALSQLGSSGSIPAEVWVDHQNRVRRMRMSFNIAVPAAQGTETQAGATGSVGTTMTMDFTSYGAVPAVTLPPANEVFDASALLGAGLSSGNGE